MRAWQWAYQSLLPRAFLDAMPDSLPQRQARWAQALADTASAAVTWLAELDGTLAGFARAGPSRDADAAPTTGEVEALYVDPRVVGTGVGRALMQRALAQLSEQGYTRATLWVLDTNERGRRFYERGGWRPDGTSRSDTIRDIQVYEVRYWIELAGPEIQPESR